MGEKAGNIFWVVGTCVSIALAIAGFGFGAVERVRGDSVASLTLRQSNLEGRVIALETSYTNIEKRLDQIYELITKHMGVR